MKLKFEFNEDPFMRKHWVWFYIPPYRSHSGSLDSWIAVGANYSTFYWGHRGEDGLFEGHK